MGIVYLISGHILGRQYATRVDHLFCICTVDKIFVCVFKEAKYVKRKQLNADMFRDNIWDNELYIQRLSANC